MALLWVTRDAKGLLRYMLLVHGSAEALVAALLEQNKLTREELERLLANA